MMTIIKNPMNFIKLQLLFLFCALVSIATSMAILNKTAIRIEHDIISHAPRTCAEISPMREI